MSSRKKIETQTVCQTISTVEVYDRWQAGDSDRCAVLQELLDDDESIAGDQIVFDPDTVSAL